MTDVILLDGSIGQELVRRSADRATPLWSTQVMLDHPDMVGDVHRDYFNVGATIATANTYAVHRSRLVRVGLEDQMPVLVNTALDQARTARDAHGSGRVAGALGPLLASYRPDLKPDIEDAAKKFAELVAIMDDKVDLFLIETVSSVQEALGALRGTAGTAKPVWLALSVEDDDGTRLRSGEPVDDMRQVIDAYKPDAVLINCTRPEAVAAALDIIKTFGLPFGAYANGFTKISDGFKADAPTVDALEQRTDLGPAAYSGFAMGWIAQGATIVGGCCEVGPDHIAQLARDIRAAGHSIV